MCSSFNKFIFASATTLSTLFSLVNGQSLSLTANPTCVKFQPITLSGPAVYVDVDSTVSPTAEGDMSIVVNFTPTVTTPIVQPYFKIQQITAQAICIVTDADPLDGAPSCFYEFDLKFCYRIVAAQDEVGVLEKEASGGGRRLGRELQAEDLVAVKDCVRPRKGRFMATGTGPNPVAITGGTGSFFGAFGEILTANFSAGGGGSPITFDATIEMCFYAGGI